MKNLYLPSRVESALRWGKWEVEEQFAFLQKGLRRKTTNCYPLYEAVEDEEIILYSEYGYSAVFSPEVDGFQPGFRFPVPIIPQNLREKFRNILLGLISGKEVLPLLKPNEIGFSLREGGKWWWENQWYTRTNWVREITTLTTIDWWTIPEGFRTNSSSLEPPKFYKLEKEIFIIFPQGNGVRLVPYQEFWGIKEIDRNLSRRSVSLQGRQGDLWLFEISEEIPEEEISSHEKIWTIGNHQISYPDSSPSSESSSARKAGGRIGELFSPIEGGAHIIKSPFIISHPHHPPIEDRRKGILYALVPVPGTSRPFSKKNQAD